MSSPQDVLSSYIALSEADRHKFWCDLYASGHTNASPMPPPSQDVQKALEGLLIGVSVLGPRADRDASSGFLSAFRGSPESVNSIETTATAMAKWWAVATAVGGPLAWIIAWKTALSAYWSTASSGERISVIAAGAATLAAVVLSIAAIVSADLKARSTASVGQYHARAMIARAYLRLGPRRPDIAARQLAIITGIETAAATNKRLYLIRPGTADLVVKYCQASGSGNRLEVRADPSEQWTELPEDPTFRIS